MNDSISIQINNSKCLACLKSSKVPKQCSRNRINGTLFCNLHKDTPDDFRIDNVNITNNLKFKPKVICRKSKFKNLTYKDLDNIEKYSRKILIDNSIFYNILDKQTALKKDNLEIFNNLKKYLEFYEKYSNDIHIIIKCQTIFKKTLVKRLLKILGKIDVNKCNNEEDVYSFIPLKELPYQDLITYKDTNGTSWGFDIKTIYKMFKLGNYNNPYDREPIPELDIKRFKNAISIKKCLKYNFEDDFIPIDDKTAFKLRVTDIFQKIDECGYYTDPNWFLNLNISELKTLYNNAEDIWNYRAYDLTAEIKKEICSPYGIAFKKTAKILSCINLQQMREYTLDEIDKMLSSDIKSYRAQGAMYILCSLVTVSHNAANTMPWLVYALIDTN